MSNPLQTHWLDMKKILWYLTGTIDFSIEFKPSSHLVVSAFFDADWDSCVDTRRATSIFIMYLGENPIIWVAHKKPTSTGSSTMAKYRCLTSIEAEVSWIQSLLTKV